MATWIIGYGMFLGSFFAACTAIFGLNTTIWGFAITFAGCTAASLILWWRDELQWKESLHGRKTASVATAPIFPSAMNETRTSIESPQQIQDWAPLEDEDFNLLGTYTQDLTERVGAVYPLVDREHVHKIVWAVMIELFCKRMETPAHSTPASEITARMARAA